MASPSCSSSSSSPSLLPAPSCRSSLADHDGALSLESLSPELLDHILSFLDVKSLVKMSMTCKFFQSFPWRRLDCSSFKMKTKQKRLPQLLADEQIVVKKNPRLVRLSHAEIGLQEFSLQLGLCMSLRDLHLSSSNFTGTNIGMLAPIVNRLTSLTLVQCQMVGDLGVKEIAARLALSKCLKHLVLRNISMGPDGAIALASAIEQNVSLESLDISENNLGNSDSLRVLVESLHQHPCISSLALRQVFQGSLAVVRALGELLVKCRSMRVLEISDNSIHSLSALVSGLIGEPTEIDLRAVRAAIIALPYQMQGYPQHSIHAPAPQKKKSVHYVYDKSRLPLTLDFSNNPLGSAAAGAAISSMLKENIRIRALNLHNVNMGLLGLSHLLCKELASTLCRLDLSNNPLGDDGATMIGKYLPSMSALQDLDLSLAGIHEAGADALMHGIQGDQTPRLKVLKLYNNSMGRGLWKSRKILKAHNVSVKW